MGQPVFPQEIFDAITHAVGRMLDEPRHRYQSLQNLALTSQFHFLHQTRSYLFRSICIRDEPSAKQLMIAQNNPSLIKYVRVVTLILGIEGHTPIGLESIINELENLEELYLAIQDLSLWPIILKLFHPSLVRLTILAGKKDTSASGASLSVLHTLPRLRRLEITGNWAQEVPLSDGSESAEPCPGCERWSSLDLSPRIVRCPTSLYSSLAVLNITISDIAQHVAAWGVIDAAALCIPSLRALMLNYPLKRAPDFVAFLQYGSEISLSRRRLPSIPSLLYLKFHLSCDVNDGTPEGESFLQGLSPKLVAFAFSKMVWLLLATNPQSSLKFLSIEADDHARRRDDDGSILDAHKINEMWYRVRNIVQGDPSPRLYPSLENVRITALPLALLDKSTGEMEPESPAVEELRKCFRLVDFGLPETSSTFDEAERALLDELVPGV